MREAAEEGKRCLRCLLIFTIFSSSGWNFVQLLFTFVFSIFVGSLIDFPKPIIGVVNGPAVGIACTILGLMDVVYATDRVRILSNFNYDR